MCMINKYSKGGIDGSDTRCLIACLLSQIYFMFHVTDKIMLM